LCDSKFNTQFEKTGQSGQRFRAHYVQVCIHFKKQLQIVLYATVTL